MSGNVSALSVPATRRRLLAIKRILFAIAAVLFLVGMLQAGQPKPKPKKHDIRHEIFALEDQWRDAVLRSDTNVLGSLLSEDYMAITPSGTLQTKQEALENMRTRKVHIPSLVLSDRKVRMYGNTALVTSMAEVQGTTSEGELSGNFRYQRVYVRDAQGRWKIVSFESNRIRPQSERKKQEPVPAG